MRGRAGRRRNQQPPHRRADPFSPADHGRLRAGRADRSADTYDMVPVDIQAHPLNATAGLAWSGDLPRQLQQVLVDTAMESFFD